ncbi:hypothetical protein [Glaciibacter psychrotolerans]|uniref:Zinc transporter ZupT n=1 Tax=Glaciibacter psychrotolerans TaxID=670054 RepID=A0A7Z0J5A5_9MICO|nr:hypothetical protein [Leifsonia psychrotolerans]NYJ18713.1 zinc transporter ZupT [Leifsonia psychrotolerans]
MEPTSPEVAPAAEAEAPTKTRKVRSSSFTLELLPTLRAGIATVGAIAALTVWFAAAPTSVDADSVQAQSSYSAVRDARATQDSRQLLAGSAPQQTVVNTWATADLLEIVSAQLDDLAELDAETFAASQSTTDARIPALLFIGVLGFCLMAAVQPIATRRRPSDSQQAPAEPDIARSL